MSYSSGISGALLKDVWSAGERELGDTTRVGGFVPASYLESIRSDDVPTYTGDRTVGRVTLDPYTCVDEGAVLSSDLTRIGGMITGSAETHRRFARKRFVETTTLGPWKPAGYTPELDWFAKDVDYDHTMQPVSGSVVTSTSKVHRPTKLAPKHSKRSKPFTLHTPARLVPKTFAETRLSTARRGVATLSSTRSAKSGFALRPSSSVIDILGTAMKRLGGAIPDVPQFIEEGPLRAHDQGHEDRCVAASLSFGVFLRLLCGMEDRAHASTFKRSENMPSVTHAYHAQRFKECKSTGRVECGVGCAGLCDPNAGTVLPFMLEAFQRGVVTSASWPLSQKNSLIHVRRHASGELVQSSPYYTLDYSEVIEVKSKDCVQLIVDALRIQSPVLMNAYVFSNQESFYATRDGRSGSSVPPTAARDVYHDHWSMPAPSGRRLSMGHCMVIVGVDTVSRKFKVRNSFGSKWGADGDFNIPFSFVSPKAINTLVIIHDVSFHGLTTPHK